MLDSDEQQSVIQLLIYLLPACNSDTLHRLLEFLSIVADHAHDQQDKDGQEVSAEPTHPNGGVSSCRNIRTACGQLNSILVPPHWEEITTEATGSRLCGWNGTSTTSTLM